MNATEAMQLCRYVRSAAPQQAIDEFTPTIWADLLVHVNFEDAKEAVRRVLTRQPFIAPAEIIAETKRIRAKRIAEHPAVIPPPDLATFEQQQAWQRELNRRIGDGETFDPNQFYVGADQQLRQRDLTKLRAISGPASAGPSSSGEDDA